MDKIALERNIWIDASRERVWQAVTEPEQVAQWFLPPTLGALMKRDNNGKITVQLGPIDADMAILEVIDPLRRVTSHSLPDRLIATTYNFADEQGGTRLTVTMTGFESLPEGSRRDRLNLSGAGWEQALENLKAFIAGKERPFPDAPVAPLFGYWREPPEKIAVERSIWIKASRERVWRAITDPEQVEKWFSPGTQWRGTGLQVGGKLAVYDPATDTDLYVQIIDLVDPPHQLVTRSQVNPPEIPHVTIWTLEEVNGGTRLTLTYTGYELEPLATRTKNMEENTFGFGMMLGNLRAYIEGISLPFPQGF